MHLHKIRVALRQIRQNGDCALGFPGRAQGIGAADLGQVEGRILGCDQPIGLGGKGGLAEGVISPRHHQLDLGILGAQVQGGAGKGERHDHVGPFAGG